MCVGTLWAADGLWIDQEHHLLYVGQLFTATVFVWNITSATVLIGEIPGFKPGFMDDFTLGKNNGGSIIGCDWTGDKLMEFSTNGSSVAPTILVGSGVVHPTRYSTFVYRQI